MLPPFLSDPVQQHFLSRPPDREVLLLGAAGTGKTTLALRRLAAHARASEQQLRALVIVPNDDLVSPIEQLCARLAAPAQVLSYADWVFARARRAFPEIMDRRSQDMPASVTAFKRHPAVREGMSGLPQTSVVSRELLFDLWGDHRLLADILEASDGDLDQHMANAVVEHAIIQHTDLDRDSYGRPLLAFGRPLVDGTPMADAASSSPEDLTVLLSLQRLALTKGPSRPSARVQPSGQARECSRTGLDASWVSTRVLGRESSEHERPSARVHPSDRATECSRGGSGASSVSTRVLGRESSELGLVDHLVIDEAQEFAPLELALLRSALRPAGCLTVVGDERQQLDAGAWFRGWNETLGEIDAVQSERIVLERAFRSHPEIATFVRAYIEGLPLPAPTQRVCVCLHRSIAERDHALQEAISAIPASQSCAIITAGAASAAAFQRALRPVRSISVLPVSAVRGREFDVVILPDACPEAFPASARRTLYVALSRARHRLEIHAVGELSSLLDSLPIHPVDVSVREPS